MHLFRCCHGNRAAAEYGSRSAPDCDCIGLSRRRQGAAMTGSRWFILGVLFVARTAVGFQFQSVASTAPALIEDFNLDYAAIGTLIGFYNLPGILMAFPSGLFGRRFGDRAIYAAGLILMAAGGVVMGVSHGLPMALVGRLLSGAGAVLFGQALTKMVTDWFAGREIVVAMGVFLASWPFGIVLGLLLQGPMTHDLGWRSVMHGTALVAAAALLLLVAAYRPPAMTATRPAGAAAPRHRLWLLPPLRQVMPLMVASVMWACVNLGLVIFFSFAPGLLQERHVATADAAALTSAALWILMVSVPVGGFLAQRSGRTGAAIVVFSAVAALALALLPAGLLPLALCAAFGVAVGPPAGRSWRCPRASSTRRIAQSASACSTPATT
jgi:predicted MFS family arabinose efflux permease